MASLFINKKNLFKQGLNSVKSVDKDTRIGFDKISARYRLKVELEKALVDNREREVAKCINGQYVPGEGFLLVKVKNSFKKRYCRIENTDLVAYKLNKELLIQMEPIKLCNLLLSNIKIATQDNLFAIEIRTPMLKKPLLLVAESENERKSWSDWITQAISDSLAGENQKFKELILGNICADCGKKGPEWIDMSWMVLLCLECSGIHRSIAGSKIRSLKLDNFDNKVESLLNRLPFKAINEALRGLLEEVKEKCGSKERERYIFAKYCDKTGIGYVRQKINLETAKELIEENKLVDLLVAVKLEEVDINSIFEMGYSLFQFSIGKSSFDTFLFLHLLGGDLFSANKNGNRLIDIATMEQKGSVVDFIFGKMEERNGAKH